MANNDYITTDCKLTVSKNTAKLDEEIFLYKNDRNIKLLIEIVDNKYRYKSDDLSNLLVKYKASYAQVKWYKNAEVKKEFPIQATDDGKVVFVIEGQLIDEDTELGDYDLQLRLLNESQESIRSLPIIKGAVHILKPLFEEGDIATVNSAVADVSMLSLDGDAIDTYNSDGTYNQTNWGNGDVISSAKLNKLEKVAKDNVDKVNKMPAKSIVEGGKIYLAKEDGTKLDSGTELPAGGTGTSYDDTEIKTDINTIKTDLGTEELTTTAKNVKGAVNEVAAQYKDIANYSLVKYTDGKVYIKKQDGTLVGTGVELSSGTDLSKVTMTMSGQTLKLLNNGVEIATVEIPTAVVTDEQITTAVNTYLTNNPISAVSGTRDINIIKWKNKKVLVDGSSITRGGTGQTQPTWPEYIKRIFGLKTIYNHSVSGTPWFDTGSSNVWSRIDNYETDADAIILMGDYNGVYSGGTIGTKDDTPDMSSYYGKLKKLAEKLINKYSLCPIIWVSEPPRASKSISDTTPINYNSTYNKMNEAMEEVCKLYGFGYCNLMTNTVFRPWIEANYNETTSDGTHPWNNIQGTMAQIIAETMKATPLIYSGSYDMTSGSGGGGSTIETTLSSLDITFNQGDAIIYPSTSLDDLKQYLTVIGVYSDGSRKTINSYTLSGTLVTGTSVITVSFNDKTGTFNVNVTAESNEITVDATTLNITQDKVLNNSGEASVTLSGYYTTDFLEIDATQPITLTWSKNGLGAMIAYYNATKTCLGTIKASYNQTVFNIPTESQTDTKYIRVVGKNDETQNITYTKPQ